MVAAFLDPSAGSAPARPPACAPRRVQNPCIHVPHAPPCAAARAIIAHTGVKASDLVPINAIGPLTYYPSHVRGEKGTTPLAIVHLYFALPLKEPKSKASKKRLEELTKTKPVKCERAWFTFDEALRRVRSICTC